MLNLMRERIKTPRATHANVKGREVKQPRRAKVRTLPDEVGTLLKKFLKNFQKPLDKTTKVWYNIFRK